MGQRVAHQSPPEHDVTPFPKQLNVVLAAQPYPLLFVTISGAHLYGFPSPDSDYDLRGVHVLPAKEAVGLLPKRETIEFSGLREGIEMDLVTHDVLKFFTMLLKRNGYVLEQLNSPLVVHTTPEYEELKSKISRLAVLRAITAITTSASLRRNGNCSKR